MPELSRFVHAYHGEYEAAIGIDGELLAGSLPRKQYKIVVGWLAFHILMMMYFRYDY